MTSVYEFLALIILVAFCVAPAVKVRRDHSMWDDERARRFR